MVPRSSHEDIWLGRNTGVFTVLLGKRLANTLPRCLVASEEIGHIECGGVEYF